MSDITTITARVDGNIAHSLWSAARLRGDRVAIVSASDATSYGELRDRAASITAVLMECGIRADERVAILLERDAGAAAAIFGVMAAGAVAVVINDRLRPRQIEHILRHSGARACITSATALARQPRPIESDASVLHYEDISTDAALAQEPVTRAAGDLAQIIYTSGSSGLPKGVTFTHGALGAGVQSCMSYLETRPDDRLASLLPFSSVYGLNQLLSAVAAGATLLVETSPVAEEVAERLASAGVTVMAAVPPLWLQLLSAPSFRDRRIPTLRVLQNAGGHLPVHAVRALRTAQPQARVFLQYGMTETFRSTFLPPEAVDALPWSMGRAVPGAEILVLREDLTPCAPGEIGELVHRGPSVAAGYWNDPEATERVFRANPLRPPGAPATERVVFSGDMVRVGTDGFLEFVSRRDRLIKTLGYRVGPDEIADVLFASGQVNECLVTTEPDPRRGNRIIAFVVLASDGAMERLTRFVRVELPRHMQPARIEAFGAIPRLASGKYDVDAARRAVTAMQ